MNYKELIIKSAIKFSIQGVIILLSIYGSFLLWEKQFNDNQKINNRKDAISLMQESLNLIYERDSKTRRLIGFFSKRWSNLSKSDEPAYLDVADAYRTMVHDFNKLSPSLSARIGMVYGNNIKSNYDTLVKKYAAFNNDVIEISLLKNSITSILDNMDINKLNTFLQTVKNINSEAEILSQKMNGLVMQNKLYP